MPIMIIAQHTPGPWHVEQGSDERDFIVADQTGNTVAEPNACAYDFSELDPKVRRIDIAEAKANARLIAAAPELLVACRDLCDAIPDETLTADPPLQCWVENARAAIAKAVPSV